MATWISKIKTFHPNSQEKTQIQKEVDLIKSKLNSDKIELDSKFQETSNELQDNIINLSERFDQLKSEFVELGNTLKTSNINEEIQIKLNKQAKLMKLLLISKFI
jgi:predicted nuclease with TOPRIM domain